MEDYNLVEKHKACGDERRPRERLKMEVQMGARWAGVEDDWTRKIDAGPASGDVIAALMKMMTQPTAHSMNKPGGIPSKEPMDLDQWFSLGRIQRRSELEIRSDSKTLVGWINGKAKQQTTA